MSYDYLDYVVSGIIVECGEFSDEEIRDAIADSMKKESFRSRFMFELQSSLSDPEFSWMNKLNIGASFDFASEEEALDFIKAVVPYNLVQ